MTASDSEASREMFKTHSPLLRGIGMCCSSTRAILAGVCAVAVLGGALVAYSADPSPTGLSDSVAYLVAARNFVKGQGLGLAEASGEFAPLVHYPPLYPLALSIPPLLGKDVLLGARWVNALLFGCLILASGALAFRISGKGGFAIALAFLVAVSPRLSALYTSVQSEALFLPLVLVGILALLPDRPASRWIAVLGGIAASLAILTRYAGLALIPAGAAILLLLSTDRLVDRLINTALYVGIAVSLPLLRAGYLGNAYGRALPRTVAAVSGSLWSGTRSFRGDLVTAIWQMLPFTEWIARPTYRVMLVALALVAGVLFAAMALLSGKRVLGLPATSETRHTRNWIGLLFFAASYIVTVGLSYALTYPTPDVNFRILSPMQIPLWLLLAIPFLALGRKWAWTTLVPVLCFVAVGLSRVPAALQVARDLRRDGFGYMTEAWRTSETVQYIAGDVQGSVITNETAALLLWGDRPAFDIPELVGGTSADVRFGDDPEDSVQRKFKEGGATLVLFDSIHGQLIARYGDGAEERYQSMVGGLELVADLQDGSVYIYPKQSGGRP